MIKLINEKDVHELALVEHIKGIAKHTLSILDDAYGEDRDHKADLAGNDDNWIVFMYLLSSDYLSSSIIMFNSKNAIKIHILSTSV